MSDPVVLRLARRVVDLACAALLVGIAALAFFQVLARYALGYPTPWSEELLRLLFVWLVLIGAARAQHMRVDLIDQRASPAAYRVLLLLRATISAGLLGLFLVHGLDLIDLTAYDRFTALPLSVQWLYVSVVVGSGLWLLTLIADLVRDLVRRRC